LKRTLLTLCILILSACQKTASPVHPEEEIAPPKWTMTPTGSLIATDVPTTIPTLSPVPTEVPQVMKTETISSEINGTLVITIVYDNNAYDARLTTAWGFAALIEYRGHTLLFDTGGDGSILLRNMSILEIDPTRIESIILSHIHGDHVGGLDALLAQGIKSSVYLIPSFPVSFKQNTSRMAEVIETEPGQVVVDEIYTTGEMGRSPPEQALVVKTELGLVVITGCAHPGVVQMVEQAQDLFGGKVYLVMGGFHLSGKSIQELERIVDDFRRLEVEKVAPCHCTGDQAIRMFAEAYGDDFIAAGVGKVILIEP
jgi:7,8-dihydropterin-6-yl-methyl-4-(beta-D-ribofuranosyl)aminobenzene 5'-phosphate synthase